MGYRFDEIELVWVIVVLCIYYFYGSGSGGYVCDEGRDGLLFG